MLVAAPPEIAPIPRTPQNAPTTHRTHHAPPEHQPYLPSRFKLRGVPHFAFDV